MSPRIANRSKPLCGVHNTFWPYLPNIAVDFTILSVSVDSYVV
jgi:hypothetical protein